MSALEDEVAQLIYTGVRSQWVMDSRTWLDLADLEPRPLASLIVGFVRERLAVEIEAHQFADPMDQHDDMAKGMLFAAELVRGDPT